LSGRAFRTIIHLFLMTARDAAGREASPPAGAIGSQPAKIYDSAGIRKELGMASEKTKSNRPLKGPDD
jgi:hypothetical protein